MADALSTAIDAWGDPLPDWIEALAKACQTATQREVAAGLGVSAGLISQVLRAKYPGDMDRIEDAVRGAYLDATIDCPALGALPTHECQAWRIKSRDFVNTNALRVRMFRACNHCPRNQKDQRQ